MPTGTYYLNNGEVDSNVYPLDYYLEIPNITGSTNATLAIISNGTENNTPITLPSHGTTPPAILNSQPYSGQYVQINFSESIVPSDGCVQTDFTPSGTCSNGAISIVKNMVFASAWHSGFYCSIYAGGFIWNSDDGYLGGADSYVNRTVQSANPTDKFAVSMNIQSCHQRRSIGGTPLNYGCPITTSPYYGGGIYYNRAYDGAFWLQVGTTLYWLNDYYSGSTSYLAGESQQYIINLTVIVGHCDYFSLGSSTTSFYACMSGGYFGRNAFSNLIAPVRYDGEDMFTQIKILNIKKIA
jgi:hypothetical protein